MLLQVQEEPTMVVSHSEKGMAMCGACLELVKPAYYAQVLASSRLNIPGLSGRYVNVAACPKCGEDI